MVFPEFTSDIVWPTALLLAWALGEIAYDRARIPRVSSYALVGFVLGSSQLGLLPDIGSGNVLLLANIAFGLILFEAGYRINLRWLRHNPWIGVAALIESLLTFVAVFGVARAFDTGIDVALLLASLSMASSPAVVLRVINELRSSGQVTERALHLSVLNCALAAFVFNLLVGYRVFQTSGSLPQAAYNSLLVLMSSVAIGSVFGIALPALLRLLRRTQSDATLVFAMSVILLVALTHYLKQSPLLATLAFGVWARHRRVMLAKSERGFGVLGDVLSVLLFVSVAASVHWRLATGGLLLGLALVLARSAAKVFALGALAHPSGVSLRKGALTGLAMSPLSVFVILVLEQTRYLGINLLDDLSALAAAALLLEIVGPLLTQLAFRLARELPAPKGDD